MYEYKAKVVYVRDGDSFMADVDVGFYLTLRMMCRLAGLNSRELADHGGKEARDHLATLIEGRTVTLNTIKPDKYSGRFLATVQVGALDVCRAMITNGYAVPWTGDGAKPVPPWPAT